MTKLWLTGLLLYLIVLCMKLSKACTDGDIRLTGGPNEFEGRLEYCKNSTWGHVCGSGWGRNDDALVVCRQLGFESSTVVSLAIPASYYGAQEGPAFINNINCVTGTEATLADCGKDEIESTGCSSLGGFVYLVCQDPACDGSEANTVRLVDGESHNIGRVEVCDIARRRRQVCQIGWSDQDATVVCRNLGFNDGQGAVALSGYELTTTVRLPAFNNISCFGNEEYFINCSQQTTIGTFPNNMCPGFAGVNCSDSQPSSSTPTPSSSSAPAPSPSSAPAPSPSSAPAPSPSSAPAPSPSSAPAPSPSSAPAPSPSSAPAPSPSSAPTPSPSSAPTPSPSSAPTPSPSSAPTPSPSSAPTPSPSSAPTPSPSSAPTPSPSSAPTPSPSSAPTPSPSSAPTPSPFSAPIPSPSSSSILSSHFTTALNIDRTIQSQSSTVPNTPTRQNSPTPTPTSSPSFTDNPLLLAIVASVGGVIVLLLLLLVILLMLLLFRRNRSSQQYNVSSKSNTNGTVIHNGTGPLLSIPMEDLENTIKEESTPPTLRPRSSSDYDHVLLNPLYCPKTRSRSNTMVSDHSSVSEDPGYAEIHGLVRKKSPLQSSVQDGYSVPSDASSSLQRTHSPLALPKQGRSPNGSSTALNFDLPPQPFIDQEGYAELDGEQHIYDEMTTNMYDDANQLSKSMRNNLVPTNELLLSASPYEMPTIPSSNANSDVLRGSLLSPTHKFSATNPKRGFYIPPSGDHLSAAGPDVPPHPEYKELDIGSHWYDSPRSSKDSGYEAPVIKAKDKLARQYEDPIVTKDVGATARGYENPVITITGEGTKRSADLAPIPELCLNSQ